MLGVTFSFVQSSPESEEILSQVCLPLPSLVGLKMCATSLDKTFRFFKFNRS